MGNEYFEGTFEDWIKIKTYTITDVFDDNFATNFEKISNEKRIRNGEELELPTFKEEKQGIEHPISFNSYGRFNSQEGCGIIDDEN